MVTADEDGGTSANAVLTVVMHPDLNGKLVTTALTHYSLTKLQEQVAGVTTYLNGAAAAPDMAAAFGLTVGRSDGVGRSAIADRQASRSRWRCRPASACAMSSCVL